MPSLSRTNLSIAIVTGLLAIGSSASASTTIGGGNVINQTWTAAGSPYLVAGDVTIPDGAFLEIEAGVDVQIASTDSQASGVTTKVEFFVEGSLRILGTAAQPVLMRGMTAGSGAWQGLVANPGADEVRLEHVQISNAIIGLKTATANNVFDTDDVRIVAPSQHGIYAASGVATLAGFEISSAGSYGIYLDEASTVVTRTIVRGGNNHGIYLDAQGTGHNNEIRHCTVVDNYYTGIFSNGVGGTLIVTDSIIARNGDFGVRRYTGSATWTTGHNNVWDNEDGDYSNVTIPVTSISSNPLFVSTTDVELTSNSPARFGASDASDQGARPYVDVATPGLHGVLWTSRTLTLGGSPYTVQGDLTVAPGTTLDIQPGVQLLFTANGDLMKSGRNATRGELVIRGTIHAEGTMEAPIRMRTSSTASAVWYGVVVLDAAVGSTWHDIFLEQPIVGLDYRDANDGLAFGRTRVISPSQHGIWAGLGAPVIDGFDISAAGSYGVFLDEASTTLTNTIVRGGNNHGIYVDAQTAGRANVITNCTIVDNYNTGIFTNGVAGTLAVTNSIIASNGDFGVRRYTGSATWTTAYNDVWNNEDGDYSNVTVPGTSISSNPNFVSGTNLRLQGSSVCIDAGTTGPAKDADSVTRPLDGNGLGGAQWDLGAYEFVLVPACGNGSIEGDEVCDDGTANGMPGRCLDDCSGVAPYCGDGEVDDGEDCDDGNAIETDACLSSCEVAACGDGFVQDGVETCDDGNDDDDDACPSTCQAATCGDGFVQDGVDACDDGNDDDSDACLNSCQAAACGDGFVQVGVEGCDDGNDIDDDACGNDCISTSCGDGVLDSATEECDDGNDVETDACRSSCIDARCGDGILYVGVEACEDGNTTDGDGCSSICEFENDPPDENGELGDGGCCQAGSDGAPGAALLAGLTLLGLVLRRRRRVDVTRRFSASPGAK